MICAYIFFGAGKFASQTYPAGELKSRGNPAKVSPANIPFLADKRKCCIFFVNAKQKRNTTQWVVFLSVSKKSFLPAEQVFRTS